ncbi:MAG: ABC transporter permease [Candidatus Eisenbacteria bacterium]|nr:ABC transporter permease [Candidatus Eisenbacteria bacterium]
MPRLFLATLAGQLTRGKALYALTVLGVALGVASVLCIQILNRNALGAFQGGIAAVSGDADLSITGRAPTLPDSVYPGVLGTPGVASAWPLVRTHVALAGRNDDYLEIIGADFFAPVRFPIETETARAGAPEDRSRDLDLAGALRTPGWVAISPALARELALSIGDSLRVSSGARWARLTVGALVDFQRYTPTASRKIALMDIAQAQALVGRRGEIDQIDVRALEGVDPAALATALTARLGPGVQVLTPEQRRRQGEGLLAAFRLNLTALSLISLFVGLFLVYTSTQASLLRRRLEFGLLRSLGATRRQVAGMILGEVALLGGLGTALGIPLGYAAANANVRVVSATLTNIYLLDEIERLRLPPMLLLLAIGIGLAGVLLGALLPTLDMSRRDVRGLLVAFTLRERVTGLAPTLARTGVLGLAATLLWFLLLGREWKPAGFVLALALVLNLPLFTPLLISTLCGRIQPRSFGLAMSLKGLAMRLQTTAFAIAALAVAVTMLVGITLLIGSFRRTVETWVGVSLQADIYITTPSWARAGADATLSPALTESLAGFPGVRAVDRLRQIPATTLEGRTIRLAGIAVGLPGGENRYPLLDGDPKTIEAALRGGACVISEPLARKTGLARGDSLRLHGPRGPLAILIAGISYDYSTEGGAAVIDLERVGALFGPGPINNIALYLEPGLDAEDTADRLKARFAGAPLEIRSNRRLREEVFAIFDQTFAITRILQGMSLLIAATGIALTLLVLARERVSELALYRSLGAVRGQVFRLFVGEGVGIGLLGLVLGWIGGIGLALILVFVINRAWFGWTIRWNWPWLALAQQAATILAVAFLASLYPALRASRTPAQELSRDDL